MLEGVHTAVLEPLQPSLVFPNVAQQLRPVVATGTQFAAGPAIERDVPHALFLLQLPTAVCGTIDLHTVEATVITLRLRR